MKALSKKQQEIYDYICRCVEKNGYPPSVREIGFSVGLGSPSTVHSHLNTLERRGFISREPGKTRAITLMRKHEDAGIPILGTVAAGEPILAVEDAIGYIKYGDLKDPDQYFALRIKGESMIGAGILDGDTVIVKKQDLADAGSIVIALLDDEATCKRLARKNGRVWLMPENDDYDPIPGDDAKILGKVSAMIRKY